MKKFLLLLSVSVVLAGCSENDSNNLTNPIIQAETSLCDGHHVDLQINPSHCGACGNSCAAEESCVAGVCNPAPTYLCDDDHAVDLQTNPAHCGACGNSCAAEESCVAGVCGLSPQMRVVASASGVARQWFRLAPEVESDSATHYSWVLNGEEISTEQNLVHVFAEAGNYALTFTATNAAGASVRNISVRIDAPAQAYNPWTSTVYDFVRAPGQYANTIPTIPAGSTKDAVLAIVESTIASRGLVSLGAYGGYIVMGFGHTVVNGPGNDFIVHGNAFAGFAEPGVIEVSWDANGNGLPDDAWYEIAGSEYYTASAIHNYVLTYHNPATDTEREAGATGTRWSDNQGRAGYFPATGWPNWMGDTIVVGGSLYNNGGSMAAFAYGYADNWPNSDERAQIDIDLAVDANGNPVHLKGIDFIKVYTGVLHHAGALGEISTEVMGAEDLSL
ncbi:MAG: PKD domain-containing protein [Cystobacterineae bacterium]|nr:PKD domain-containing protein [Cystobacterineae bacterium]